MPYIRTNYSLAQRWLHWLTVLLVLFNLLLPGSIEHVIDAFDDGRVPLPNNMLSANLHIYIGFAILALTVMRLIVRLIQGAPGKPVGEPDIFHLFGKISHAVIYVVLIIMPALGAAKYFLGVNGAGDLHGGLVKVLLWALIAMHIGAVLVHQFWWKTNLMARMVRG